MPEAFGSDFATWYKHRYKLASLTSANKIDLSLNYSYPSFIPEVTVLSVCSKPKSIERVEFGMGS
mgnify:FL=1